MCAIIGYCINSESKKYSDWLIKGTELMSHRGPDDKGLWWSDSKCIGLGHRRLSVIDLSIHGKQPMQNSMKNQVIVFNGEIYNHKDLRGILIKKGYHFNSLTDTEVILNAYLEWGTDCLTKFNGMFAFVIYDKIKKIFFCARDRAGEKPFFYSYKNKNFFFSSELKVFLKSSLFSKKINHQSMECYLAFGYVPGELCIADDVKKLSPAHAMIYDTNKNTLKVWRYWELPKPQISRNLKSKVDGLVDEFESLMENAIKKQMVADVPVGILLSGGIDSSLIATIASKSSSKIKTFTIGFDKFKDYDERHQSRKISNFLGTDHFELDAGDISPDIIKKLAYQFDEPIADSSMLPTYLVSSLVKKHCTVVLGGDGGDELFGGYKHYDRLLWCNKYLGWLPNRFKKIIANTATEYLPIGFRGRNWLQSLNSDFKKELPLIASFFDRKIRGDLVKDNSWLINAESIWKDRAPKNMDFLDRLTRMDFKNYMAEDILVKVDRASMLNSLEIRSPFLDKNIIEFAFGQVPHSLKANTSERKIFLKILSKKILPPDFDLQRKQGFSIPIAYWLKSGVWKNYFKDILFDEQCMFDKKIIKKLFHGQDKGFNNSERIFSLGLFELWRREYLMKL
mgnify:CR=1 FL=1|tara:strand:+ start:1207 stop:3072 length:1866 start_codon:yes stop_codon:yes gene_type:complete